MLEHIVKDKGANPEYCIIWMHGLGSDAQNMFGAAQLLNIDLPLRHVFVNAPLRPVTLNQGFVMRAWFDIHGLKASDRIDIPGMQATQAAIEDLIQMQNNAGFKTSKIFIAGFSQGAAMALWLGLMHKELFAGIIALSGFLPMTLSPTIQNLEALKLFFGLGLDDEVIYPAWTLESASYLQALGCNDLTVNKYKMAHSICEEEMQDLSLWLVKKISESAL